MEKKFQIPSECRNLIPYFWGLKQAACDELRQSGIDEEPAQAPFEVMQQICDQHPQGPLANYVRELKKGFRMSESEILAYDQKVQEQHQENEGEVPGDNEANEMEVRGESEAIDHNDDVDPWEDGRELGNIAASGWTFSP